MSDKMHGFIGELLGTFVFFTVILFSTDDRSHPFVKGTAAWAIPAGLLGAILAFGSISGGHFNPGVTFLMYLKNLGTADANGIKSALYVIAQLIGAAFALGIWKSMGPNGNTVQSFCNICNR